MPLDQNSSALISGGASGLGEPCVRRLHATNASVVFLDVPESRGEALANELGKTATFVPGDASAMTRPSEVLKTVRRLRRATVESA